MSTKTAIIIGAGPGGLTAAHELQSRAGIRPVVLEKSTYMGGLARTVHYKGNRIDIGGHRFFSKSDRVMQWWFDRMPIEALDDPLQLIRYQGRSRTVPGTTDGPDPETSDRVMLVRPRRSRVYYLRKFFNYPISLSAQTVRNLGLWRTIKIGCSYMRSLLLPIRKEKNLEQFLINRFGRELYQTFFKSYTEKVWGVPCDQISAEWGAQRIKGLSITRALAHAIKSPFRRRDVAQKTTETSLIEQFLYPKYGPGQMWDIVANEVRDAGGEIHMNQEVRAIRMDGHRVAAVEAIDQQSGEIHLFDGDYFFSTMPVKELVSAMDAPVPQGIRSISEGLVYRDFITVGLLLEELLVKEDDKRGRGLIRDNWIYIQEPDVQVGRLQIFNNWSPYMVADPSRAWVGLEYFCNDTDEIWQMSDDQLHDLAARELSRIGIIEPSAVLDSTVIKMPKTYPAYFGTYDRFDELRSWLDEFENLFLIGRNGMHKYNNQDHAMLTAMVAVDNIINDTTDKSNIWMVNTEEAYHEEKIDD